MTLTVNLILTFHCQIHQFDSTNSRWMHNQTKRLGVVTHILVTSTRFQRTSGYVGLGKVVRLDDGDTSNTNYTAFSVRTLTTPITVENLGGLSQRIELCRADEPSP